MKHVVVAVLIALITLFLGALILVSLNFKANHWVLFINAFIAYGIGRYSYEFSKKHWK